MPLTADDYHYVSQVQDLNRPCKQDRDRSPVTVISQGCSGPEYWPLPLVLTLVVARGVVLSQMRRGRVSAHPTLMHPP